MKTIKRHFEVGGEFFAGGLGFVKLSLSPIIMVEEKVRLLEIEFVIRCS
jgi:hypothetical protein